MSSREAVIPTYFSLLV